MVSVSSFHDLLPFQNLTAGNLKNTQEMKFTRTIIQFIGCYVMATELSEMKI